MVTSETTDATRRFVIARGAVRGEYVRLTESWRSLLARRSYAEPVVALLGECLAASALFTSTLKMLQPDGGLTLQIQGGKPVSLLIAECRAELSVRAMARVDNGVAVSGTRLSDLARGADFALTIDPGGDYDSYQSLVPIESGSVAEALNDYMRHSEQIATHFVLAANAEACAGILVQQVPHQGGRESQEADPDTWNRIRTLTATLTAAELLELGDEEVLRRLFHQEEVRVLPPRPVTFVCRCSKERVGSVLKLLGTEEIRGLLADRRTIEVECDFCGLRYAFSAEEAWAALNG